VAASIVSIRVATTLRSILVTDSVPNLAVTTADDVTMMSPMRPSRRMGLGFVTAVMALIAKLDSVTSPIQPISETVVTRNRCDEREEIQTVVDSLATMTAIGLSARCEEESAQDEGSEYPDLQGRPLCRIH
jgi:hypothetical protein